MDNSKLVLSLRNISKRFNEGKESELVILEDVNLDICSGEMVTLVGPSGCGKTTLLQISGLLETPNSGNIIINGNNYSNVSDKVRTFVRKTEIGFVYQFHHLLMDFTALENLVIPQMISGKGKKEAIEKGKQFLSDLNLYNRLSHFPSELSGGEKQRVAIARSLINEPLLLLADEPTGSLDPSSAAIVFDILVNLVRKNNLSMLLVTHDYSLAKKTDKVVIIENKAISEFSL